MVSVFVGYEFFWVFGNFGGLCLWVGVSIVFSDLEFGEVVGVEWKEVVGVLVCGLNLMLGDWFILKLCVREWRG